MFTNVISCKNNRAGGDDIKFPIEKQVLGVIEKIAGKNVKNEKRSNILSSNFSST